jgi:DnaJ-class molecular chaperone
MAALSVPEALQLLHLEPGATRKQIRVAYKRLALQLHPDKQHPQQSADATAAFARLSAAYSLLAQGLRNNNTRDQHAEPLKTMQPFETAYATGSLFSEQLVDEAVLVGTDAADIWTL